MRIPPGRGRRRVPHTLLAATLLAGLAGIAAHPGMGQADTADATSGAGGDPRLLDPRLLDAAWTLFELGAAQGDAPLLASAAETVLAIAGGDPEARATAAGWLVEARFLARGEAGLLARIAGLESLQPDGPTGDLSARPSGGLAVVRVPPGTTVEIRPAGPVFVLRSGAPLAGPPRQAGRDLDCAPLRTGGLGCPLDPEAGPGAGPVSLAGPVPEATAAPAFAFLATVPGTPEGETP